MTGDQFASFLSDTIAADVKSTAMFGNNFLHIADRSTLLALQHGGQGGRLAELNAATIPQAYHNPFVVPTPVKA